MPGFIPILIGAAILGGAVMLSKKSGAAPPMPPAPPLPPSPPSPPPSPPSKEIGNPWVALTRAQIAATHPYEADAPTEISPKIATVKPGSYVHVFFRNMNPSVPGEWGVIVKITGGPHFMVEGEGAGVYWSGVVSAESTKPGGPPEGSTVNDFPSEAILHVNEPVGAATSGIPFFEVAFPPTLSRHAPGRAPSPYDPYGHRHHAAPLPAPYSSTLENPFGHRRPDSPYDPYGRHGMHSPHYPYSPYDPYWWHRRY